MVYTAFGPWQLREAPADPLVQEEAGKVDGRMESRNIPINI